MTAVETGKLLGSNVVSAATAQVAADLVADMRDQYAQTEALDNLARSPGKTLTKAQSEKAISLAGKVAVSERQAKRERYEAMLQAQKALYDELRTSGEALSHQGLWTIEKERLGGMTDAQRQALLDQYRRASAAERSSNSAFLKLGGLSDTVIDGLARRADLRTKAAAVAETTSYYVASFKGALSAAYALNIGGPDLRKGLAAGSLVADSVFQGAQLLATSAALPTPVLVFQFVGLAGNFASGMNGLFGGGKADPFQEQFAQFQQALFGALNALSSQVGAGFAMTAERFDQLERRLDVVLVVTSGETLGRVAKCREILRDFSGRFDGSMAEVAAVLIRNARYQTLAGCYDALHSSSALEEASPSQFQTQVQLGLGAAASQYSASAQALREQGDDFLDHTWPEATFIYADLLDSRKPVADAPSTDPKPLGSFDLLTRPSANVAALHEKIPARVSADDAKRELGPILAIYLGSNGRRDWRLENYLKIHIEPRSTLSVLGALNATSHLMGITRKDFQPITEVDQKDPHNRTLMAQRDEERFGLLLDYWPVSLHVLAQESLISGDPIAPNVSAYLGEGECGVGTDVEKAATEERLAARRKHAACVLVREAPLLAANVAMLRLRAAYEGRKRPTWTLGYKYALGEPTDWALRDVLGDLDFRRLVDASSSSGAPAWFLKLAGSCDGIKRSDEAGMVCEGGSCKPPVATSSSDSLQARLKACVVTRLPSADDLEASTLLATPSVNEAYNIAAGLHGRLKRRAALEATPSALRPLVNIKLEETR